MPKQLSMSELKESLPYITSSPTDAGELKGIVIRPKFDERKEVDSVDISLELGVHGDRWLEHCWIFTEDGKSHPDVQICLMNARCIEVIAQQRDNWAPAGDNLFVDLDLSPENLPTGTKLQIGSAVVKITDTPHLGCAKFIERYGRDACVFVNTGIGKQLRLRGIYARVVQDGTVSIGDKLTKIDL